MARPSLVDSSTVSTKLLIGATGLALILYLVVHLGGNLLLLLGSSTYNGYAAMLLSNPLLVPVEIGLTAIFIIHVYKAVVMWWNNRKARPSRYYKKEWAGGPTSRKTIASSTMVYTGLVTLFFIVLHVKAFKYGHPGEDPVTHNENLYGLVTGTFHDPLWVAFYEICLVVLGFHLWHGFSSAFESLGLHFAGANRGIVRLGKAVAILIAGGFLFIPLWAFFLGGRP